MIITIDGPAGSGKSTIAEHLAKRLNFIHFNSGSLYRGVTAYFLDKKIDFYNITDRELTKLKLTTLFIDNIQYVYVNDIDYTSRLRDNEVSISSPLVSNDKRIREIIDTCQRKFGSKNNIVIDGRDTGSFVFPNADVKFYLECSLDERARRRFKEEKSKKTKIKLKDIKEQIRARDEFDMTKQVARLVVPDGAIIVDSTKLSIEQVVDKMLTFITIK